ncbi:MAG: insulinase family protein [Bacteroides sp.]|nr:insulinase family protein [Bacteroides sp.]
MSLNRTIPPSVRSLDELNILYPERLHLKNGIPLNIIQAGTEEVVRFDLLVGAGQWHQTQSLQAMFTNRLLREGTVSLTSRQIAERLDYYGAVMELSSSVNCGFITLYSLNKHFPKTLEIVADMLMHPTFPKKELDVVLEVNKQRFLINSSRVEMMARKKLNRSLFGEAHPLGRYAEADDYDRITPELLRAFYNRYYHSGNCSIYVSGKVTKEIITSIEHLLGDAPWGNVSEVVPIVPIHPQQAEGKHFFVEKDDALQSSIKLGGFVMDRLHPDFLKARVMVTLFGGYFGSRLMSNIREEKGYTYGIGAGIVTYPDLSVLVISTEADNEYASAIIDETYKEMDRLCNDLVPQAELDMVKNYMLGDWCRSYEGPFSMSDAWIYIETGGLDDQFFVRTLDSIQSITREEVRQLAQTYLCKENLIEVVAGKKM